MIAIEETDLCQRTWPSNQPTRTDSTFRQHRCGFTIAGHLPDEHWCRYCAKELRT